MMIDMGTEKDILNSGENCPTSMDLCTNLEQINLAGSCAASAEEYSETVELIRTLDEIEGRAKYGVDTCQTIVGIWKMFCASRFHSSDHVTRLMQLTVLCVFGGGWFKVPEETKSTFQQYLTCASQLNGIASNEVTGTWIRDTCTKLVRIIGQGIWDIPYLRQIFDSSNDKSVLETIIDQLWEAEDCSFIKARIEKLCLMNEYKNASGLALAAILKGRKVFTTKEDVDARMTQEEYFQFGAIYTVLIYKLEIDSEEMAIDGFDITYHTECVARLRLSDDSNRIAPKWRKGWKYRDEAVQFVLERYVFRVIKLPLGPRFIGFLETVVTSWLTSTQKLNSEADPETWKSTGRAKLYSLGPAYAELRENQLTLLNTIPIETIEVMSTMVLSNDYLYTFAKCLGDKFGVKHGIRSKCVELCVSALLRDVNQLEMYRLQDNSKENVTAMEMILSERYLQLATYLEDDIAACFDVNLTSFSLNPTKEIFDRLKDLALKRSQMAVDNKEKYGLVKEEDPASTISSEPEQEPIWEFIASSAKCRELGISESVLDGLSVVITNPRLTSFNTIQPNWAYFEPLCLKHLETRGTDIKDSSNLELARPDYSKYKSNIQLDDDNETIFEAGFEPSVNDLDSTNPEDKALLFKEPSSRLKTWKSGLTLRRRENNIKKRKAVTRSRRPEVKKQFHRPRSQKAIVSSLFNVVSRNGVRKIEQEIMSSDFERFTKTSLRIDINLIDQRLSTKGSRPWCVDFSRKRTNGDCQIPRETKRQCLSRTRTPVKYSDPDADSMEIDEETETSSRLKSADFNFDYPSKRSRRRASLDLKGDQQTLQNFVSTTLSAKYSMVGLIKPLKSSYVDGDEASAAAPVFSNFCQGFEAWVNSKLTKDEFSDTSERKYQKSETEFLPDSSSNSDSTDEEQVKNKKQCELDTKEATKDELSDTSEKKHHKLEAEFLPDLSSNSNSTDKEQVRNKKQCEVDTKEATKDEFSDTSEIKHHKSEAEFLPDSSSNSDFTDQEQVKIKKQCEVDTKEATKDEVSDTSEIKHHKSEAEFLPDLSSNSDSTDKEQVKNKKQCEVDTKDEFSDTSEIKHHKSEAEFLPDLSSNSDTTDKEQVKNKKQCEVDTKDEFSDTSERKYFESEAEFLPDSSSNSDSTDEEQVKNKKQCEADTKEATKDEYSDTSKRKYLESDAEYLPDSSSNSDSTDEEQVKQCEVDTKEAYEINKIVEDDGSLTNESQNVDPLAEPEEILGGYDLQCLQFDNPAPIIVEISLVSDNEDEGTSKERNILLDKSNLKSFKPVTKSEEEMVDILTNKIFPPTETILNEQKIEDWQRKSLDTIELNQSQELIPSASLVPAAEVRFKKTDVDVDVNIFSESQVQEAVDEVEEEKSKDDFNGSDYKNFTFVTISSNPKNLQDKVTPEIRNRKLSVISNSFPEDSSHSSSSSDSCSDDRKLVKDSVANHYIIVEKPNRKRQNMKNNPNWVLDVPRQMRFLQPNFDSNSKRICKGNELTNKVNTVGSQYAQSTVKVLIDEVNPISQCNQNSVEGNRSVDHLQNNSIDESSNSKTFYYSECPPKLERVDTEVKDFGNSPPSSQQTPPILDCYE